MDEKRKKYMIYGGVILGIFILYYVLFTSEAPLKKDKPAQDDKPADLASLLSSSSSGGNSNSDDTKVSNDSSLFESDFYNTDGIVFEEDPSGENHPIPQGEAPINPQTGKPYNAEAMRQFDAIRKIMPDNELIPKRMTSDEKEAKKQKSQKILQITRKVNSNQATRQEAENYFQHQEKVIKDRLQIINYLMEKQEEEGYIDEDGKFKKVKEGAERQMKILQDRKSNYLKKFEN